MGWHAAPRIKGFDYVGIFAYALTICTYRRVARFLDAALAEDVVLQLRRSAARERIAVLAYCVMLDHIHLVVQGSAPAADLRRFVTRGKQASGYAFARRTGQRLWQQGFYDHVIRGEPELRRAIVYCVTNPIRAGLVTTVEAWSGWGSDIWSREELARFVGEDGAMPSP